MLLVLACGVLLNCSAVKADGAPAESTFASFLSDGTTSPHLIRVYVSAVNCEMNREDAARLNALAQTAGLSVEVVFAGIQERDTTVLAQAAADLGLNVWKRLPGAREFEQFKSIGGVRLPMAVVLKARQLKTFIAGESMPRTMSLLEASMSPTAGQ